ncbi:GDP-L-fucose synthase, partial [bacterium]|nr:GDP-L-fucose synthase [bacterium]
EAVLKIDSPIPINLGSGSEIRIKDLIDKIVKYCEYDGEVRWNSSKPDGQPRRLLDISKAKELLGWEPKQNFDDGLRQTVEWYKNNIENCR